MDWLRDILTSSNGVAIAAMSIVIIILAIVGARHGLLSIRTKRMTISNLASEQERTIMRNQIGWVKIACQAFEDKVPKYEGYDVYRGKYVIERVLDEIIEWIYYNHIEATDTYIEIKQEIVWNMVTSLVDNERIKGSKSFKKECDSYVKTMIERLVSIREEYSA